jgi:hypothetical protein
VQGGERSDSFPVFYAQSASNTGLSSVFKLAVECAWAI